MSINEKIAKISLQNITLDYPVYNAKNFSLRHQLVNAVTGGKIQKTAGEITYVRALSNINLDINHGDRIGILGHNGAGKTSLLRCISGIYQPTYGKLFRQGTLSSYIEIAAGLDPELTGYENIYRLLMFREIYRQQDIHSLAKEIIEFSELSDFIYLPVRTYSSGMLMRLVFSTVTSISPDIMVMDEFFSAGDVDFQIKAMQRLNKQIDQASILIFASHDINLIQNLCNRFYRLTHGVLEDITHEF